jgi:Phosphoribosylanthranilate isomerase
MTGHRTKIKICGITNFEDALLSVKLGADALGFNFYKKSPRYIKPENAYDITTQINGDVLKVGVFVNEDFDKIMDIAKTSGINAIQLHGEESPEFAARLKHETGLTVIKAFRVSPDFVPEDVLLYDVDAILLDAYSKNAHGGTGHTFDWEIAKKVSSIFPIMYLAGGISPANVAQAIDFVAPYAIDACSGLESEPGVKDESKMLSFLGQAIGNV